MRTCGRCSGKLDMLARRDARFCSTRCRVAAHRAARVPPQMVGRRWVRAVGKRPVTTHGAPASSTNARTWSSLDSVRRSSAGDGFGVMLGGGLGCYDLDHVSPEQVRRFLTTVTEPVVLVERSMSGTGAHVFVEAEEAPGWRRVVDGIHVERYTRHRFIRTTLDRVPLRRCAPVATTTRKRPMRVVAPGEKPPPEPPKAMTVAQAASEGTHRDLLVAMRDRIALAVQNPATPARDLASLSRRLQDIAREIKALDLADQQEAQRSGRVEDESFDASAI